MSEMPARIWADMYMGIWLGVPQPDRRPEPPIEFVRADIAERMVEALEALLNMYIEGANSGDWGHWYPEQDKEVIAARSALSAWKDGR